MHNFKCQNSETSKLWSKCPRASNLISIHMEPHRLCKIELSPVTSSGMQQQDFPLYLLISNHSVCSFSLAFQRLIQTQQCSGCKLHRVGKEHHRHHEKSCPTTLQKVILCAHPTLPNPRKNLLLPFISCHSAHSFYDYIHTSNLLCEIKGKQTALHDVVVDRFLLMR